MTHVGQQLAMHIAVLASDKHRQTRRSILRARRGVPSDRTGPAWNVGNRLPYVSRRSSARRKLPGVLKAQLSMHPSGPPCPIASPPLAGTSAVPVPGGMALIRLALALVGMLRVGRQG